MSKFNDIQIKAIDNFSKRLQQIQRTLFSPGTQIIYVPSHAQDDIQHPDRETGFVTSIRKDVAFCRYWSKYSPRELRTKANSEATPFEYLVIKDTVPQENVDKILGSLCRRHRLPRKDKMMTEPKVEILSDSIRVQPVDARIADIRGISLILVYIGSMEVYTASFRSLEEVAEEIGTLLATPVTTCPPLTKPDLTSYDEVRAFIHP